MSPLLSARRARGAALPAFYAAHVALAAAAVAVFAGTWLDPVVRATGGPVNEALLVNLAGLVVVLGVVLGLGRLRPADVGLRPADLPRAAAVVLLAWAAVQAATVALGWLGGEGLAPDPLWARRGVPGVVGLLLAQVLGNALVEEVGYRGFLLPQLHLRLGRAGGPRRRLALALGLSQGLFALMHLPNRLSNGLAGGALVGSLLVVFGLGLLLALLYLRTGNLLLVVGVHALMNAPTLLVASPVGHEVALGVAVALLLACWRRAGTPDRAVVQAPARLPA